MGAQREIPPVAQPSTIRETSWMALLPDFGKGRGMGWAAGESPYRFDPLAPAGVVLKD